MLVDSLCRDGMDTPITEYIVLYSLKLYKIQRFLRWFTAFLEWSFIIANTARTARRS